MIRLEWTFLWPDFCSFLLLGHCFIYWHLTKNILSVGRLKKGKEPFCADLWLGSKWKGREANSTHSTQYCLHHLNMSNAGRQIKEKKKIILCWFVREVSGRAARQTPHIPHSNVRITRLWSLLYFSLYSFTLILDLVISSIEVGVLSYKVTEFHGVSMYLCDRAIFPLCLY